MAASTVIIEERTGKRRRLDLAGAGLPKKGAEWAAANQLSTQRNPGNTVKTQHVLGPEETPSDWEGEWNTTRLIATPCSFFSGPGVSPLQVVQASVLMDLLESILRSGQLLRVTWVAKENRRIVRLGRASEWRFQISTSDDIEWSVEFDWIGRGDDGERTVSGFRGDNLLVQTRAVIAQANEFAATIEEAKIRASNPRLPKSASTFTLGQLEQLADGPRQLVDSVLRAVDAASNRARHVGELINKVRDVPAEILGELADSAANAVAVLNNFVDTISREGPETTATRAKVSSLLRATSYYSGAQTQAELLSEEESRLARAASRRRAAFAQRGDRNGISQEGMVAVYLPRDGDTMVGISLRFYGADLSYQLSRANGLPGGTIKPPRRALVIPTRQVLDAFPPGA